MIKILISIMGFYFGPFDLTVHHLTPELVTACAASDDCMDVMGICDDPKNQATDFCLGAP